MPRFDLYTHVHKALRTILFDALEAVGRTDFSRASELAPMLADVRRAIRLSGAHAAHEDREIHPLLHRLAPELAAELETGHDRFEGTDGELERLLERIERGTEAERVSLGRRVHEVLGALVADHLRHMALEEQRANRVLWAHLSDAELLAVQDRVVAAIAPEEMSEWLEYLVLSGNLTERAALLGGMRAALPAEVFVQLTARARARAGEARWSETLAAAESMAASAAEVAP